MVKDSVGICFEFLFLFLFLCYFPFLLSCDDEIIMAGGELSNGKGASVTAATAPDQRAMPEQ